MQTVNIIIYFFECFILVPLGIYVNKKLYDNIKSEEHLEKGRVIQHIVKTYSLLQCLTWPCIILVAGIFYVSDVVLHIIEDPWGHYGISALRFIYGLNRDYVSFHSLIIASARFVFLVFPKQSEKVGIKLLRTIFIGLSFAVPIFNNLLYEATRPIEKGWVSLFRDSTTSTQKKANITSRINEDSRKIVVHESPIYLFFNNHMPADLMFGMGIVEVILMFIIYSNVVEGCLYAYTIRLYRRKENRGFLDAMLSEDSKKKRQRKNTISLQTTIMVWLIEFIAGVFLLASYLLSSLDEDRFCRVFLPIDITLCSIVIPCSYILKTQIVKTVVEFKGWWRSLTDFLPYYSVRVRPAENIELNCMPNENVIGNDELKQNTQTHQSQETLAHHIDEDDDSWWMNIDLFDDEN